MAHETGKRPWMLSDSTRSIIAATSIVPSTDSSAITRTTDPRRPVTRDAFGFIVVTANHVPLVGVGAAICGSSCCCPLTLCTAAVAVNRRVVAVVAAAASRHHHVAALAGTNSDSVMGSQIWASNDTPAN